MDGGIHNSSIFGLKIVTPCFPSSDKDPSLNITIRMLYSYFLMMPKWSPTTNATQVSFRHPSTFNEYHPLSASVGGPGEAPPSLDEYWECVPSYIHHIKSYIHPPAAWLLGCVENTSTTCFLWHGERDPLEGNSVRTVTTRRKCQRGEEGGKGVH